MKKLMTLVAVLATVSVMAQWIPWQKIEGNGQLRKENRSVGNFTAISSSGSWDVMLAYGEAGTIQVEGDENLLEYIETQVEGGKLVIRSKKSVNLRSKNKITIYVSLTRLTGISLSGSGDIMGEGKFSNEGTTEYKVSGSGSIRLALHKVGKAELAISGSGNIRLSGSAGSVIVRISGSGNADCGELISDNASAHISGSGNIKLYVNNTLEASVSGSGNITYRGAASDIRKRVSGSGRVTKIS
ncbi:MAG: DUF2807 domain-containing protein [Chitinophagaceae bacterium]|nr:DUF2807 domain-containing protein [Chitinophagaceae bacterium]